MTHAIRLYVLTTHWLDALRSPLALLIRVYVAKVFLASGLTKTADWGLTVALFENEYQVPFLPPAWAALLGTGAELVLPVLLAAGLGTRLTAIALFAFNIVAVVSYPELSDAGLKDHVLCGALLAVLVVHGGGALSADRWLERRLSRS